MAEKFPGAAHYHIDPKGVRYTCYTRNCSLKSVRPSSGIPDNYRGTRIKIPRPPTSQIETKRAEETKPQRPILRRVFTKKQLIDSLSKTFDGFQHEETSSHQNGFHMKMNQHHSASNIHGTIHGIHNHRTTDFNHEEVSLPIPTKNLTKDSHQKLLKYFGSLISDSTNNIIPVTQQQSPPSPDPSFGNYGHGEMAPNLSNHLNTVPDSSKNDRGYISSSTSPVSHIESVSTSPIPSEPYTVKEDDMYRGTHIRNQRPILRRVLTKKQIIESLSELNNPSDDQSTETVSFSQPDETVEHEDVETAIVASTNNSTLRERYKKLFEERPYTLYSRDNPYRGTQIKTNRPILRRVLTEKEINNSLGVVTTTKLNDNISSNSVVCRSEENATSQREILDGDCVPGNDASQIIMSDRSEDTIDQRTLKSDGSVRATHKETDPETNRLIPMKFFSNNQMTESIGRTLDTSKNTQMHNQSNTMECLPKQDLTIKREVIDIDAAIEASEKEARQRKHSSALEKEITKESLLSVGKMSSDHNLIGNTNSNTASLPQNELVSIQSNCCDSNTEEVQFLPSGILATRITSRPSVKRSESTPIDENVSTYDSLKRRLKMLEQEVSLKEQMIQSLDKALNIPNSNESNHKLPSREEYLSDPNIQSVVKDIEVSKQKDSSTINDTITERSKSFNNRDFYSLQNYRGTQIKTNRPAPKGKLTKNQINDSLGGIIHTKKNDKYSDQSKVQCNSVTNPTKQSPVIRQEVVDIDAAIMGAPQCHGDRSQRDIIVVEAPPPPNNTVSENTSETFNQASADAGVNQNNVITTESNSVDLEMIENSLHPFVTASKKRARNKTPDETTLPPNKSLKRSLELVNGRSSVSSDPGPSSSKSPIFIADRNISPSFSGSVIMDTLKKRKPRITDVYGVKGLSEPANRPLSLSYPFGPYKESRKNARSKSPTDDHSISFDRITNQFHALSNNVDSDTYDITAEEIPSAVLAELDDKTRNEISMTHGATARVIDWDEKFVYILRDTQISVKVHVIPRRPSLQIVTGSSGSYPESQRNLGADKENGRRNDPSLVCKVEEDINIFS